MTRLLTIMIILLILSLPALAVAQEPANGVITGQVINDTEGSAVSGVEVTLITYIDNKLADTRTTITDNEGNFSFENIDMEHIYLISAKYMEVDYYYQVVFAPGETTAYVSMGVCDVTTDDGAIRIGKEHKVIELEEEGFCITDILWLFNDGSRTLTGKDGVLVFTLPEGAYNLEAPQELMIDYHMQDNGSLAYLVPFPPGERQLAFSYRLARPDEGAFSIPFVVDYPVDSLEVMVTGEGIEVMVDRMAPADPVFAETGERFIHFEGTDLQRNSLFHVTITGPATSPSIPVFVWIIVAVFVASVITFVIIKRVGNKANER
jgi:5-hydroxyisourate hydrolase-like protein (transthyretin family)